MPNTEKRDDRQQTIEIDCAPATARPNTYIKDIIKDTGLELREPAGKFFGNWTWDYNDVSSELWDKIKPILKARITALFHSGFIRYGSW